MMKQLTEAWAGYESCRRVTPGLAQTFRSAFFYNSEYRLELHSVCASLLSPLLSSRPARIHLTSTYWRAPLFRSERFCHDFVTALDAVRAEFSFLLIGWVLRPEYFHLLLKPEPADSTPALVKQLKQRTAWQILGMLREHEQQPWRDRMLRRLRLPQTVHSKSRFRVWERRYYPFNVYSEQKLQEKLDYLHANPVKRGLISSPEKWPWSSFRFYYLNDASVLRMDRLV